MCVFFRRCPSHRSPRPPFAPLSSAKMLPLTLLKAAENAHILIELKNGDTYNGTLVSCNMFMNINLKDVVCTSRDGDRFWKLNECYVRGNSIKYLRIPDEIISIVPETTSYAPAGACMYISRGLTSQRAEECGRVLTYLPFPSLYTPLPPSPRFSLPILPCLLSFTRTQVGDAAAEEADVERATRAGAAVRGTRAGGEEGGGPEVVMELAVVGAEEKVGAGAVGRVGAAGAAEDEEEARRERLHRSRIQYAKK